MRALVLEGGAMRGIFTAGVLDAMAGTGMERFDLVVGVSAGAYCAASYLAGQPGRILRIITNHMTGTNYTNPWRMLVGGSLIDQAYLLGPVTRTLEPLDVDALRASPSRFEVVTTHAHTAVSCYIDAQGPDCLDALHATVAIPFFYKGGPIRFRHEDHFDGSVSDPLPVARAIDLGATEITAVVVTPPSAEPPALSPISRLFLGVALRDWPKIPRALARRHESLSRAWQTLATPPPGVSIRVIATPPEFPVSRFTRDRETLIAGYEMGRAAL